MSTSSAPAEKHKVFDEATIVCRSGRGGNGEIVESGKGRWVRNFKYRPGAGMRKQIWLSAGEPAPGQDGAHVVIAVDGSVDSLLHLHAQREWSARRGAHGNPVEGSGGPKRAPRGRAPPPALRVPVPPGTLVRDRRGRLLADLVAAGDTVTVAHGGRGGAGVKAPAARSSSQQQQQQQQQHGRRRSKAPAGVEIIEVEDADWAGSAAGARGEEVAVTLQLRVAADVGIVGLPNAGKSSLLSAATAARPAVAPYPFTTLMPNLGVLAPGGGVPDEVATGGFDGAPPAPVLVDLPGLIEGAHVGRGLGRVFLRHLSRARVVLHVVDAAAAAPASDYRAIREELRMYNPSFCRRPAVVALNKMDLPDAAELREEILREVELAAERLAEEYPEVHTPPVAVVPCSAASGEGVADVVAAVCRVLSDLDAAAGTESARGEYGGVWDWDTELPES